MRKVTQCILHTPILALIDVLLINLGLFLAEAVLNLVGVLHGHTLHTYLRVVPLTSLAAVAILYVADLYSGWLRKSKTDIAYAIGLSSSLFAVATMALSFWERQFSFPRSVILLAAVLQCLLLLFFRLGMRSAHVSSSGVARALLIANTRESAESIAFQINRTRQKWMHIEDIVLAEDLVRMYETHQMFDTIVVAGDVERKGEIADFCAAHRREVMIVPALFEFSIVGARALQIDDILLLNVRPPHLSPGQRMLKRIFDVLGATTVLVVTGPLLVFLALLIRLTSKGSALFKQHRVGRDGNEYTIYKFRTMVDDAEKGTGPVLATEDDPRITPLGRTLRATRLDELPQLFNIIKGDMSLVGPRPERAHFVREFCMTVPSYQYRMSVKPGITGLAQVYGRYSTTAARKLRFDLMYIYDYSLVLDLKILLKTIQVVFEKERASGLVSREISKMQFAQNEVSLAGEEAIFKK